MDIPERSENASAIRLSHIPPRNLPKWNDVNVEEYYFYSHV